VERDGTAQSEDLTLAARNALLNMIDHLQAEYGYTRQQAYPLCSLAVDLKVSEVVDLPTSWSPPACLWRSSIDRSPSSVDGKPSTRPKVREAANRGQRRAVRWLPDLKKKGTLLGAIPLATESPWTSSGYEADHTTLMAQH
jgi:hypothetical protein